MAGGERHYVRLVRKDDTFSEVGKTVERNGVAQMGRVGVGGGTL